MRKIILSAIISGLFLLLMITAKGQSQSDRDFKHVIPVYEIGKIEILPPVMVPGGVTVADKNDVAKAGSTLNSASGNSGNANEKLSTKVPVINTADNKKSSRK